MACSSCGKRRAAVSTRRAQKIASGEPEQKLTYSVTEPNGKVVEFTSYIEASRHRRRTKGTLSTSS